MMPSSVAAIKSDVGKFALDSASGGGKASEDQRGPRDQRICLVGRQIWPQCKICELKTTVVEFE